MIDPATLVDDEIVETGVGTIFQFIRRDAFVTDYRSDAAGLHRGASARATASAGRRTSAACTSAGTTSASTPGTCSASARAGSGYPESYGEVDLIQRPPTIEELALAAPVVAETRAARGARRRGARAGLGRSPAVGAAAAGGGGSSRRPPATRCRSTTLRPAPSCSSCRPRSAPRCWCARRAASPPVSRGAVAPLETFDGRVAADLAPEGWTGREAPRHRRHPAGARDGPPPRIPPCQASSRARSPPTASAGSSCSRAPPSARARCGSGSGSATDPPPSPERVAYDDSRVSRWRPGMAARRGIRRRGPLARFWQRADLRRAHRGLARPRRDADRSAAEATARTTRTNEDTKLHAHPDHRRRRLRRLPPRRRDCCTRGHYRPRARRPVDRRDRQHPAPQGHRRRFEYTIELVPQRARSWPSSSTRPTSSTTWPPPSASS